MASACCCFLLARYFLRERIERKVRQYPRFALIEHAIAKKNGGLVVALLRLSPLIPFNVLNYALGILPLKFLTYALTSWIMMAPGTLLFVYIGFALRAATEATAAGADSGDDDATANTIRAIFLFGGKTSETL